MIAPLGYIEGLTIGEHERYISNRSFHLVLVGERDSGWSRIMIQWIGLRENLLV